MIKDLDGPDPAPNRRGHVLVISLLLLVGVVAGYAAVSSPELRGPYATPRPSVVNAPRITPAPVASLEPAAISVPFVLGCVGPDGVRATIAVGSPLPMVAVGGPLLVVYDRTGQNVIASVPMSVSSACGVVWGQPPNAIPFDRVSR